MGDYDKRTVLHFACSEGQLAVVQYLVRYPGINLSPIDRWGSIPMDDARKNGCVPVISVMKAAVVMATENGGEHTLS